MRLLILGLLLSLLAPAALAQNPAREDAAREFAFCYVYFYVASLSAPPGGAFGNQAEDYKQQAAEYGTVAILLTNEASFKAGIEAAVKKIESFAAGDPAATSAELEKSRRLCAELPTRHAALLAELAKELANKNK